VDTSYGSPKIFGHECGFDLDSEAQIVACLRFSDALAAMEAIPERDRGLAFLMQRGRIPDFAWKRIHAAMEIFAADLSSPVH